MTKFPFKAAGLLLAAAVLSPLANAKPPRATDIYSREQLAQSLASCADLFPGGRPVSVNVFPAERNAAGLCSNSFAVIHSSQTKTPLLVVERLTRASLKDAKGEERTDEFFPDPRLKVGDRASLNDYKGSGFDRGHMAPAADQPDATSMVQSFSLSHIVPQDPTNNRKVWAKLEGDTRKYAERAGGPVFVYSGPLFQDRAVQTIGKGKVWVPTHLYKLVYDSSTQKAWAHVLPNTSDARIGTPISYEAFKAQTGLDPLAGLPVKSRS